MTSLLLAASDPLSHVVQHTPPWAQIGHGFWSFPLISNHILMQIVTALLLVWLIPKAVQSRRGRDGIGRLIPAGLGNAIEAVCLGLKKNIFEPNLGKYTDIFTPYLWSLFFFILVSNALGMIPLSDWFYWAAPTGQHTLIGGTSTGNVFVTATLAIATLILMVGAGLRYHGMNYLKHFFMGPPYIAWFIAILEIFGLLFNTLALCVRLFANMLAGHIIIAVLLGFIPAVVGTLPLWGVAGVSIGVVLGAVAFNLLEIIIVVPLHAFIFTTLTAVFIGLAVNIHHDEHHDEEHAHHGAPAAAH
jgi:F-type H+-transporting ATPase subunit a